MVNIFSFLIQIIFLFLNIQILKGGGGNGGSDQCNAQLPCLTCETEPTQCKSCISGIGRKTTHPCTCEDGYYQKNQNQNCALCDDSVCGTCENNSSQCIISCNSTCKTCNTDGTCKTCDLNQQINSNECECIQGINRVQNFPNCQCQDGYYSINSNSDCINQCDNTQCGTCQNGPTLCIVFCDDTCQTCNTDGSCATCLQYEEIVSGKCQCVEGIGRSQNFPNCQCIEGYYQINNEFNCGQCDNTKCGTCQNNSDECIISCDSTCKTCKIDGTCDTCEQFQEIYQGKCQCATNAGRIQIMPSCLCQDGYYQINQEINCGQCDNTKCGTCQNLDSQCIVQCNNSCKTCNIDGTCSACDLYQEIYQGECICSSGVGRSLAFPQCSCQDGYYQINQQNNCGICDDTKCGTCQNISNNCIVPCNSTCKTCNIDGSCLTCEKYQKIEGQDCVCIIGTNRYQNFPNCQCKEGFYHINNQNNCEQCDKSVCATCQNSPTECIVNCGNTCKTCNIDGTCQSCQQFQQIYLDKCICTTGIGRSQDFPSCKCQDGYYQIDLLINCAKCDETVCGTCQSAPTQCIISCDGTCQTCNTDGSCATCLQYEEIVSGKCQCVEGIGRSQNFPNCQCIEGYYQINNEFNCGQCDNTKCGTCQNNSDECIISCDSTCKTCKTDGTCDTCNTFQEIYQDKCQCIQGTGRNQQFPDCLCQDGYYQINLQINCGQCDYTKCGTCQNLNNNCIIPCHSTCQTCNIDGTCSTCDLYQEIFQGECICIQGVGRSQVFPQCSCQEGYYQINQQSDCGICDDTKCGTCQNMSDNCIVPCNSTCKTCNLDGSCATCQLYQEINNQNCECVLGIGRNSNFPNCQCIDGYYQISEQNDCGQCDDKICATCEINSISCIIQCDQTCQTCNTDGTCKTCNQFEEIYMGKCKCSNGIGRNQQFPDCLCMEGYYQINQDINCGKCNDKLCGTCTNSENNCQVFCDSSCQRCNSDGSCKQCFENQFLYNGNCITYTKQECQNCFNLQEYQSQICPCSLGQYLLINNEQFICNQCQYPCSQCCSHNICLQCISQVNRIQIPDCQCIDGYYNSLPNNICTKCHYKCQNCLNYDTCTLNECSDLLTRDQFNNCECKFGYYDDFQIKCLPCNYPCLQCINANICISCQQYNLDHTTQNCECIQGFYHDNVQKICKQCNIKCQNCVNNSNNCLICNNNLQDQQILQESKRINLIKSNCSCKKGYFENFDSIICQKCQYPCLECTSLTKCIENKCINNKYRYPDCQCFQGYYDNGKFCE